MTKMNSIVIQSTIQGINTMGVYYIAVDVNHVIG